MASWKYILDIKTEWEQCKENKITVQELGKIISKKLIEVSSSMSDDLKYEAEDIAECFNSVEDVEDFDSLMNDLYDFADTIIVEGWSETRLMWVNTF